ncbi:hypothetical protein ASPVEDRAFT_89321 [Aspergillus versicolor CBS 583.65]|uniref:ER membrane protein complex subunit 7 beta-sandwich domain-containing protein n=1 Tax=Aspergillus versicolor CBS 583.65 TaxID=1036611 RepID=A0A1L9Q2X3_ASPVE|nr:uncharacterized protein ASPVEDRAFT_89321 [Aspergillus versicolor CBS 583.65]OJJ08086.1 hypothetical protein ASPVEDRAFT_89321 [Aspergillus versicolor CBS 583.65]
MHLLNPLTLLLLLITPALSDLTLTVPPSPLLPNPHSLPADTHATLTSTSLANPIKAPLTRSATFVFSGIASSEYKISQRDDLSGSYLLDIRSSEYVFTPLRVDLDERGYVKGVWETFRGNEWGNRGVEKYLRPVDVQAVAGQGNARDVVVDVKVVGKKGFYEVRQTFSPLSLFKNPMILLALVALGFTFGMPKLMENMDPEMREEFEKQSRASPMAGAQNAMAGGGPANFDLAGWMAGAAPRAQPVPASPGPGAATGRENKGGARRR